MCGIVGYLGSDDARGFIIDGLHKLEYRGYDSAGISLFNKTNNKLTIYKDEGRVANLESITDYSFISNCGIGHTRWATHGKPNKVNAHPHISTNNRFTIVHNGVIDNYRELQINLLDKYKFISDTDTEVIVNLIEYYSIKLSVEEAIRKTMSLLEGSYALLILDNKNPNVIYAAKNKSPLLIGYDALGISFASDIMALVSRCDKYATIPDKTFIKVTNEINCYDIIGKTVNIDFMKLDVDSFDIDKGEYPHFMIKEIHEQPSVIRRIISKYISDTNINIKQELLNEITNCDRIYIIGAGTSMHAGLVGKMLFERGCKKPVEVHIASEFAYNMPIISEKPLFIMISQSGETADLRSVLVNVKNKGYKTITITNVSTSTLAREADYFLEILAGPEIAVASTKAYIAQICVLAILSYSCSDKSYNLKKELSNTITAIEYILEQKELIHQLVKDKLVERNCFYIGRGVDYYACMEAALKLKEISYIQTEGFAAGELKHGTIALIEEGTPVIAIISQKSINNNTRSNLSEVVSRGANPIVISTHSCSRSDDHIIIPDVYELFTPIVTTIPAQLISYYAALERNFDIDKPRNLAKSVTVE